MKLLLAEDERELSNAIVRVLKHNNYTVDAVYDGAEALEYLTFGNYDGVILDIMMPKADGLTVLRKVREGGNNVPVLLLTARSEVDDRVEGLDAGADDFNFDGDVFEITTDPNGLGAVRDALEAKGYSFISAEVEYIPQTMTAIDDEEAAAKMEKLIDMLEENDDVQAVWHNWDMPEDEE